MGNWRKKMYVYFTNLLKSIFGIAVEMLASACTTDNNKNRSEIHVCKVKMLCFMQHFSFSFWWNSLKLVSRCVNISAFIIKEKCQLWYKLLNSNINNIDAEKRDSSIFPFSLYMCPTTWHREFLSHNWESQKGKLNRIFFGVVCVTKKKQSKIIKWHFRCFGKRFAAYIITILLTDSDNKTNYYILFYTFQEHKSEF